MHASQDFVPGVQPNGLECGGVQRGVCSAGVCTCRNGFGGPSCEAVYCVHVNGGVCSNVGVCDHSTNRCVCNPGFMGYGCEIFDYYTNGASTLRSHGQIYRHHTAASEYAFDNSIQQIVV